MDNKVKLVIKVMILSIMMYYVLPITYASAGIIKQVVSKDGLKTYYVSTNEENLLVFNIINARMETEARVIYSGEFALINKTEKYLRKYYYSKLFAFSNMYQDNIYIRAYNVSSNSSYVIKSIKYNKNRTITVKYSLYYLDTLDQSKYVINKVNEAIKNNISNLKTDYDKACWAYQWVLDNTSYDFTNSNSSVYSGIMESGTVCRGYALLYNIMAEKLGINCRYVEGAINQSLYNNHAWNIVKLNGKWYCVDTTWGDNVDFGKYFLKSKDTFALAEYQYHDSKIYDNYMKAGEVFSEVDYIENENSETQGVLPSVYNIKMDILKRNTLKAEESYNFMINNPDNVNIYFKSDNPAIAKVDKKGVIIGISKGVATITAYNQELKFLQSCVITVKLGN